MLCLCQTINNMTYVISVPELSDDQLTRQCSVTLKIKQRCPPRFVASEPRHSVLCRAVMPSSGRVIAFQDGHSWISVDVRRHRIGCTAVTATNDGRLSSSDMLIPRHIGLTPRGKTLSFLLLTRKAYRSICDLLYWEIFVVVVVHDAFTSEKEALYKFYQNSTVFRCVGVARIPTRVGR